MPAPVWVIGGGTAGCTVLARLASATTLPLVLAEPGPLSVHDEDPGFCGAATDARLVRTREVSVCDGAPPFRLLEARALGGGSAVNGLLLTGAVPPGLEGLTRQTTPDDAGPVGRLLLGHGGRPARLWWNKGRWNPGRAAHHLVEEGRVDHVVSGVESLVVEGDRVRAVIVAGREHAASAVVLCAGAIATPLLLLRSGVGARMPRIGLGLQNHPEIAADVVVAEPGVGGHDATVVRTSTAPSGRSLLTVAYERVPGGAEGRGRLATMLLDPLSRGAVSQGDGDGHVRFAALDDAGDFDAMRWALESLVATCARLESSGAISGATIGGRALGQWRGLIGEELDRALRAAVGVVSHPAASCAEVVDDGGRLVGLDGIWVADASALARVPACTPAAEVVMLARRVADAAGEVLS